MKYWAAFLIALMLAQDAFGQVSEQDKADAVLRAKQFTQRLRRTQDIRPLLREFFVPDFLQRIEQDSGHNTLVFTELSEKQKFTLTESQRQQYYFASMNSFYLAWVYHCWREPKGLGDDDVNMKDRPVPAGVRRIIERSRSLSLLMFLDEMDEREDDLESRLPKNPSEVATLTKELEQISSAYRRSMGPLRRMSDKRFENILSKCEGQDFYKLEMASCNDRGDCPGVPKGVPLIGVRAPLFEFIDFARLDGNMKIVRLFLWDESLK